MGEASVEDVQALVQAAFPGDRVTVESEVCHDHHFHVEVVSDRFAGRSLVDRHRLVHAALQEVLGTAVHAVIIQARTPDEAPAA